MEKIDVRGKLNLIFGRKRSRPCAVRYINLLDTETTLTKSKTFPAVVLSYSIEVVFTPVTAPWAFALRTRVDQKRIGQTPLRRGSIASARREKPRRCAHRPARPRVVVNRRKIPFDRDLDVPPTRALKQFNFLSGNNVLTRLINARRFPDPEIVSEFVAVTYNTASRRINGSSSTHPKRNRRAPEAP